jgi:calmodulin
MDSIRRFVGSVDDKFISYSFLSYANLSCQLGQVTLEEFTSLMKGELSGRDPWEEMRVIFAVLSKDDGSGPQRQDLVTVSKLKAASKAFNVRLSGEELEMMIQEVDRDGGGTVDFNEYTRILSCSAWF